MHNLYKKKWNRSLFGCSFEYWIKSVYQRHFIETRDDSVDITGVPKSKVAGSIRTSPVLSVKGHIITHCLSRFRIALKKNE